MKKGYPISYADPVIEIVDFNAGDVITTSSEILSNDESPTHDDGGWT